MRFITNLLQTPQRQRSLHTRTQAVVVEDNHQHSLQEQPAEVGRVRNHPAAAVGILAEGRSLGSELHIVAVAVEEVGAGMQLHSENQHLHKAGELRPDQCTLLQPVCLLKTHRYDIRYASMKYNT